jgi:hypothetical protein
MVLATQNGAAFMDIGCLRASCASIACGGRASTGVE